MWVIAEEKKKKLKIKVTMDTKGKMCINNNNKQFEDN